MDTNRINIDPEDHKKNIFGREISSIKQRLHRQKTHSKPIITMRNYNLKSLFSKEDIHQRTIDLSQKISTDYKGKPLVIIGVLKGSFIFLADLIRSLTLDVIIDFIHISSYGSFKTSSANCVLIKDLNVELKDRDVLVVEDIIDTGGTLSFLLPQLLKKNPKSLKTCTLINKKSRRKQNVTIDYCGFTIENGFVVGFGLDYNEKFRSLPGIYELTD